MGHEEEEQKHMVWFLAAIAENLQEINKSLKQLVIAGSSTLSQEDRAKIEAVTVEMKKSADALNKAVSDTAV